VTGCGLNGRSSILDRVRDLSLRHSLQTRSMTHRVSSPVGTGFSFYDLQVSRRLNAVKSCWVIIRVRAREVFIITGQDDPFVVLNTECLDQCLHFVQLISWYLIKHEITSSRDA
jgi:hypothetical protein